MECKCGKSEIFDVQPENTDIIICPFCKRKYTYVNTYDPKTKEMNKKLKELN